jgi:hypothetical protein
MKNILQNNKECYVCKTTLGIHKHHIFGASNRTRSEKMNFTVFLCGYHHNLSNEGVHFNKDLDTHLKKYAQEYFEANLGTREDFRIMFGKSYL